MKGVTFGEKHSFNDWGLILKSRPVIGSPNPKKLYIDIPASDGQLDLTESLTGNVAYDNRTLKFEFIVLEARKKWNSIYSELLDYMHGKKMNIVFDEDPSYFYFGRINVDEWQSSKKTSTIVITAEVEPYKHDMSASDEDWIWDIFNFEDGVIREWTNYEVEEELTLNLQGSREASCPTFTITTTDGTGMMCEFEGVNYHIIEGTSYNPYIVLKDGNNELKFEGNGVVSISYRGGRL